MTRTIVRVHYAERSLDKHESLLNLKIGIAAFVLNLTVPSDLGL